MFYTKVNRQNFKDFKILKSIEPSNFCLRRLIRITCFGCDCIVFNSFLVNPPQINNIEISTDTKLFIENNYHINWHNRQKQKFKLRKPITKLHEGSISYNQKSYLHSEY